MEKPVAMPLVQPKNKYVSESVAPIEASALAPRFCPTMTESTRLYICCTIFPNKTGSANDRRIGKIFPSVIFFVYFFGFP